MAFYFILLILLNKRGNCCAFGKEFSTILAARQPEFLAMDLDILQDCFCFVSYIVMGDGRRRVNYRKKR
jgi:hypothetical protein